MFGYYRFTYLYRFFYFGFYRCSPKYRLGGNIAMLTIGCINLILSAICAPTTRDIKLPPHLEEEFNKNKNFIDIAISNRLQHHF